MVVCRTLHVFQIGIIIFCSVKVYSCLPCWSSSRVHCRIITCCLARPAALTSVPPFVRGRTLGDQPSLEAFPLFWAFCPKNIYGLGSCSIQGGLVLEPLTFGSLLYLCLLLVLWNEPSELAIAMSATLPIVLCVGLYFLGSYKL